MTAPKDVFIRLVYGQGGKGPLSFGFILFRDRLAKLGYDVHDDILWKYPDAIAADIQKQPANRKVAVLGYSLGGNCASWVACKVNRRPIELIVAYDPSIWSPINVIPPRVARCLCFHNTNPIGTPFGHAVLKGNTVETVNTFTDHALVCYDGHLHQITLNALAKL